MFGIVLAPFTIGTAFAAALLVTLRGWAVHYTVLFGLAVISAVFVALSVVNFVEGGWPLIGRSLLWLVPAEFIWIAAFSMLFKRLAVWQHH
ncbi:MAG: hypothetical protein J0I42_23630 [Bosea sp.]|uniref:hypothetical protein n=1 Tax=Bosea sp. (in: a-proteobacteria) TaxID=1871050 RepID=UPI001AC4FBA9|nr:hypothetical protein [Bosea sp. (in: a-proteobacteria)]MBN9454943.1 hypothetical protein [Bosea sp. (in: a-proteobacteria)]